jgi:hypothetical protein
MGVPFSLSFTLEAEAGLSWWNLWLGNLRIEGDTFPTPPLVHQDHVVLNTVEHPLPSGHYALTLIAGDGVARASTVIYFDIANAEGGVDPVDRWRDASCGVDLNQNGYPDCVDRVASTLTPPTDAGKPNLLALLPGLFLLLGGAFVVVARLRGW